MHRRGTSLTAEALAAGVLAVPAAVMIAGSVLDVVRLPLAPWLLAVLGAAGGWTIARAVLRSAPVVDRPRRAAEIVLFVAIAAGVFGYLAWLASPSLFPIAIGPDIVHHLSLVHAIQRTHRFPHGSAEAYLGEMVRYTPGSHALAAAVAMWLRVDALRVVYPVLAGSVALKSALLFLVTARVLPATRSPLHAVAAPVLSMVPSEYFFGSILKYGFYAQVVSETFAVAMLFATVMWAEERKRIWLVVFAACGCATFLAWPVWLPAAMLALFVVVIVNRPALGDAVRDMLVAFGPILLVALLHVATHRGGASILVSAGDVTRPSVDALGATFIVLAGAGALMSLRSLRARPVLLFASAIVVQAIGLAVLNRLTGSTSLYLPYKMMYLFLLPCAVVAAVPLTCIAVEMACGHWALRTVSAIVPLALAVPLMWGRVPHHRQPSPMTESSYAAGLWARNHLPAGCIDYFTRRSLTGYWLHLDLLGNPRVSPRMDEETFDFRETVGRWIEGRGLPYAIVEDLSSIPRELRPKMETLQPFGSGAVVKNRGQTPIGCRE